MKVNRFLKKVLGIVLLGLILGPVIFYYLVLVGVWGRLPDAEDIQARQNLRGSVVLSSDDHELGRFYIQDRSPVKLAEISPNVTEALIATEDERFYSHDGTDYRSLFRVFFKSVLRGDKSSGGGSTLSQQLAKNMFPRVRAGKLYYPVNKVREIKIASLIEDLYTKDEILEKYLNTVSFGEDVYGIESASRRFFNKPASQLSRVEAATLVGMLKATTSYNPVRHPEASLERRNVVLGQLERNEIISEDSARYYQGLPLITNYVEPSQGVADYFLDRVRAQANSILSDYNASSGSSLSLETAGLTIRTTLDFGLQKIAQTVLQSHLANLQKQFNDHWSNDRLWQENRSLLQREIEKIKGNRSSDDLQVKKSMIIYTPEGPRERQMSSIDSLKYYLGLLHSGMVSMDPHSGAVMTWVGGRDHQYFPYDHVNYSAKRQVGSVFKPVVYATALENDLDPCTYYKAEQVAYEVEEGQWKPANSGDEYEGKYTMEGALEGSINTIAVKILDNVGIDNTIQLAHEMGIRTELPAVPSLALGTASISPLEMATVYSTISNGGLAIEPYMIESISMPEGDLIYEHEQAPPERVLSKETSAIMVYMLQNVVNDGTARSLRTIYGLKNDIGGKTGTTQGNADGWFIATTPGMVTAIWTGGTYPAISFRDTRLGQGATMALPIFGRFESEVNRDGRYARIAQAKYPSLPDKLRSQLDCDPFKEDFELFEWLFGSRKNRKNSMDEEDSVEEKNLFKRIGSMFKKKKRQ